jgi:DNA-binding transcriptional LysR family regulator
MTAHFDLVDIRLFVNIAETNSLTRGAQRSNISLPSASTRMKHFENDLGVRLLNRTGHGITLTAAGQTFLHHARVVLQQLEQLDGDLQEHVRGMKGHVRIFANASAITEFLPLALPSFLATHPDISVDLRERLSPEIVRAVKEGRIDIGIVSGKACAEGLRLLPYYKSRLVLATARNHPLAQRKSISFEDTLNCEYIGLSESSAIHTFLNQTANRVHKSLKVRIHVGNFEAVCRMIEANVGIGVLPEYFARRHAKIMKIKIVPLTDEWAVRDLHVCIRRIETLPKFVQELVDLLTAGCA